ncbi:MAG: replication-associated recombination protein A [Thermodesulfovibrionales bacterium]
MDLFKAPEKEKPLAWRLRPGTLEEFLGQEHLLSPGRPLRNLIERDRIVSLILYGPPGTGKTALAHVIAARTNAQFLAINAVTSGVKEIREAVQESRRRRTILFIDEIHRFNRVQQDALLPHVESGEIILIGASTHNPFFALVPALASRSTIFQFSRLSRIHIAALLRRAVSDPRGLGEPELAVDEEVFDLIASLSDGDARRALNMLELAFLTMSAGGGAPRLTASHLREAIQTKTLYYDEDDHYDTISAFIKSMRGSDPDAAVYWLSKMVEAGEDPMFIARRIVICASEDIGNADPQALPLAVAAMNAVEKIGMPEGAIPLAHATIYLACAPKSNASYLALNRATEAIRQGYVQEVPLHLRDSHYKGADRLGSGVGYKYPHDYEGGWVEQQYMGLPASYYEPTERGFERTLKERMDKRRKRADV